MIHSFTKLEDLKKVLASSKIQRDINSLLKLELPFFDYQDKVSILYFPLYRETESKCLIIISKKNVFVYSPADFNNHNRGHKTSSMKPNGESTIMTFLMLKYVLKNYSEQFQNIRDRMNELETDPILDLVEDSGRTLRRLTDKMESFVELIIVLKQRDIKQFDTDLVSFDYEVLSTEARYWLERCRSHIYRIASLRTKSEMKSNRELNDTMGKLTVIMTILTIVSIVVSVPGTIGAIFGIPALSEAYFSAHTPFLIVVLIVATLLSILLGFIYWKSLGLKYKR
jgi:Mg2+ and Co2+ transporter CorA